MVEIDFPAFDGYPINGYYNNETIYKKKTKIY